MTAEQVAVAEANETFYRARSARDLGTMADLWFPADWAECVHPGEPPISGWDGIRESWRRLFEGSTSVAVAPAGVKVRIVGDVAWVSCLERIAASERDQIQSSLAHATNVFVRHDGRWRLVVHHASAVPYMAPPLTGSGSLVN